MADDAKRIILARRARYMAAAIAGIAASGCEKSASTADAEPPAAIDGDTLPRVCLSPPAHMRRDASAVTPEQIALLDALLDASVADASGGADASAADASVANVDVKLTATVTSGKLPHAEANAQQLRARARLCWARAPSTDAAPSADAAAPGGAKPSGAVVLEVKVTATGEVESASVRDQKGVSSAVATCLASAVPKIVFEDVTAPATVTITATFAPAK